VWSSESCAGAAVRGLWVSASYWATETAKGGNGDRVAGMKWRAPGAGDGCQTATQWARSRKSVIPRRTRFRYRHWEENPNREAIYHNLEFETLA